MLRLTGLPSPKRFPCALVRRDTESLAIDFSGPGASTRVQVPTDRIGEDADLEEVELRLLGRLQELGYEVRRDAGGTG